MFGLFVYHKVYITRRIFLHIDFNYSIIALQLLLAWYGGVEIERVTSCVILGLTVTDDLTWNLNIDNIVAKAAKMVYLLDQLKRDPAYSNMTC